eukprot:gene10388-13954_t
MIVFIPLAFLLINEIPRIDSFRTPLHRQIGTSLNSIITNEGHIFKSNEGPILMENGPSYIELDFDIKIISDVNISSHTFIKYAIFSSDEEDRKTPLVGICYSSANDLKKKNPWANNIATVKQLTLFQNQFHIVNSMLNGTYFQFGSHLKYNYPIPATGWYNVELTLCIENSQYPLLPSVLPVAAFDGDITYRNPYGFIPAELYGLLPFEGARMIAYVLFSCYFIFYYCRHWSSILPLHNAFLIVFLFALAEAIMWYATYQSMNLTGQAYCCPFPPAVVGSLILQIFRMTLSRSLLLVVSLGYGIVRPKLMSVEWIAVTIVSVLYFITATAAQVSEIKLSSDYLSEKDQINLFYYKIPEMLMDVLFLTWIYMAMGSTIRILTEFQQTEKLKMYKQLVTIIAIFATLFTIVTLFYVLDQQDVLTWPWQFAWVQQVIWELLNFAVLASVCVVCRPTENSRLLAYASQLPTSDPDDDDDDQGDFEMAYTGKTAPKPKDGNKKESSNNFDSLPDAESDDDEYGLNNND